MKEQTIDNGSRYLIQFDSLGEMADYVLADSHWAKMSRELRSNGNYLSRPEFVGRDFNGDLNNLRQAVNGHWPEGMEIFYRLVDKLEEHQLEAPQSIRRRAVWSEESGDELCLDRLKYGQPYWRTTHRDARPGPINVTIITDIGTLVNRRPEEVFWRGVSSVVLSHLLEKAGYRVNLLAANACYQPYLWGGRSADCIVELKRCEEPLDTSTLCNAVSGWCYRTLWFASRCREGETLDSGVGQSRSISHLIEYATPDQQAIICQNVWAEHAAVRWLEEQLTKFKNHEFNVPS